MTTRPKLPHPPRHALWNNEKQSGPGCAGTHHRAGRGLKGAPTVEMISDRTPANRRDT
jgi:hypothetical protein